MPSDELGIPLDAGSIQLQSVLLESYKLRHAEIIVIIRFMSQVSVTGLGLLVTLLVYSLVDQQPRLLLFVAPLAGLTCGILINGASAMLRLAYAMCQVELMFARARVRGFDWELKYGGLGVQRLVDWDSLMILAILIFAYLGGTAITIRRDIIVSTDSFLGVPNQVLLAGTDVVLGAWLLASSLHFLYRKRSFARSLQAFGARNTV